VEHAHRPEGDEQPTPTDIVRQQRTRIRGLVSLGQRIGYGLFAAALIGFIAGFTVGFSPWVVNLIIIAMVIGSIVLAPAIVFGHAATAADREDRDQGWGPGTGPMVRRPPEGD